MYRVTVERGRTLYFTDWCSACEFCVLAGLRIKIIRIIEVRDDRIRC